MPAVSIIIPTKDRGDLLVEALASLRAQTFTDFEALVVDDASTEDIAAVVDRLGDRRIRCLRLPPERHGAPAARNFGVGQAAGDYIIFLDSDDTIAPHCLARRVEVMKASQELDFAVFQCSPFMDVPGDLPFTWNTFENRPGETDLDRFLSRDNVWQTTAPIWRKSALAKFAGWNEAVPSGQDWEFHTRALISGLKYQKFNEVDCYWRRPSEARESIGKRTFEKSRAAGYARARPAMLDHVREALIDAAELTPARRRLFAGMYWEATRRIAERAGFREARHLWVSLLRRRCIGVRDFLFGGAFLITGRSVSYSTWLTGVMDRRWDAVARVRRRPQYLLHRLTDAPPAVSVIMIAQDNWRTIDAAIRSLLSQQWQDFELIIVDNASRDRTSEIVRRIASTDARIRLFRRKRRNLTEALALALTQCRGEFIARMSADGTARFGRLHDQVQYLGAHPGTVLLGGSVSERDERYQEVRRLAGPRNPQHDSRAGDRAAAVLWQTAMMRRGAVEAAGGYRAGRSEPEGADLYLFQRLADVGAVANLDRVLVWQRHDGTHA